MDTLEQIKQTTKCIMAVSNEMIQYTKEHENSTVKYSEEQIKSEFPTFKKIVLECFDILKKFSETTGLIFTPNHIFPLTIAWSYDIPNESDGHYWEKSNLIRIYKYYKKDTETIEEAGDTFKDLEIIKHACIHEMLHMLFTNVTSETENGEEVLLTSRTGVNNIIDWKNIKAGNDYMYEKDEIYTEFLTNVILGSPYLSLSIEEMQSFKKGVFNALKTHVVPQHLKKEHTDDAQLMHN